MSDNDLIKGNFLNSDTWVATAIIQLDNEFSNDEKLKILNEVAEYTLGKTDGDGIILFPAGWFNAGKEDARSLYEWVERNIIKLLSNHDRNIIISVGIDGRSNEYAVDQIAVSISKNGFEAIGRKFYPTETEENHIEVARDYISKEDDAPRIFELNGKRYYLAVCYDVFGIKKLDTKNPGVDIILNLIHRFAKGESEANFARHGLAGASNKWRSLVFATAVFYKTLPRRWPSGVLWNKDKTHDPSCTYDSIRIKAKKKFYDELLVNRKEVKFLVRIFSV